MSRIKLFHFPGNIRKILVEDPLPLPLFLRIGNGNGG